MIELDLGPIEERLSILGDSTWEDFRGYADGSVSISPDDGSSIDVRRWKGCVPFGVALLHANKDIAALVAEVKRLRKEIVRLNDEDWEVAGCEEPF
jgi:hypothetical protein